MGTPALELDPRIRDDDYIFQFIKTAPSIFYETPLKPWLVTHCIDTTIITGCTTSGCVRASVVDDFSAGYRTIVPEDYCGDQDEEAHASNLHDGGGGTRMSLICRVPPRTYQQSLVLLYHSD